VHRQGHVPRKRPRRHRRGLQMLQGGVRRPASAPAAGAVGPLQTAPAAAAVQGYNGGRCEAVLKGVENNNCMNDCNGELWSWARPSLGGQVEGWGGVGWGTTGPMQPRLQCAPHATHSGAERSRRCGGLQARASAYLDSASASRGGLAATAAGPRPLRLRTGPRPARA
jgi:hypothetical protein